MEAFMVHLQSPFAVAVMGNPITRDFEIVGLDPTPIQEEQMARFRKRGMRFLGFVGIQGGRPQMSLDEPLDADAMETLSEAYLVHLRSALDKRLTGASCANEKGA